MTARFPLSFCPIRTIRPTRPLRHWARHGIACLKLPALLAAGFLSVMLGEGTVVRAEEAARAGEAAKQTAVYQERVNTVSAMPGFVALWDFVARDPKTAEFIAHQPAGSDRDFRLEATNYVLDFWGQGRPATYEDFPLLGRGPFGQAVLFQKETDANFRPCFLIPRGRLHDSGLDAKGAEHSVSMVAWVIREGGNHAIGGIWHEGTDLAKAKSDSVRVEPGKRQYALFAGLAANNGACAAHISENGGKSFGDKYARNIAVTKEVMPAVSASAAAPKLDRAWSVMGFVFDNQANTVTAYLDGVATDFWIENPAKHPFFRWPAQAWLQAELHRRPGHQPGEIPNFPKSQFYTPPEDKAISQQVISESDTERVEERVYPFTKVRVTLTRSGAGEWEQNTPGELVALKANPFWFAHDLYNPESEEDGGPFTIGRVIHSGRSVGFTGYIGGIAVFDTALSPAQMQQLAGLAHEGGDPKGAPSLLQQDKVQPNEK